MVNLFSPKMEMRQLKIITWTDYIRDRKLRMRFLKKSFMNVNALRENISMKMKAMKENNYMIRRTLKGKGSLQGAREIKRINSKVVTYNPGRKEEK